MHKTKAYRSTKTTGKTDGGIVTTFTVSIRQAKNTAGGSPFEGGEVPPLWLIRNEKEYDRAADLSLRLSTSRESGELSRGGREYLEALNALIGKWDEEHHPLPKKATPLEILCYLVEENDMSASDLGRLLGQRTLGSKLLRGERGLSKEHIRKLASRFRVNPGLFI